MFRKRQRPSNISLMQSATISHILRPDPTILETTASTEDTNQPSSPVVATASDSTLDRTKPPQPPAPQLPPPAEDTHIRTNDAVAALEISRAPPSGVCKMYFEKGHCKYGSECRFAHIIDDSGVSARGAKSLDKAVAEWKHLSNRVDIRLQKKGASANR